MVVESPKDSCKAQGQKVDTEEIQLVALETASSGFGSGMFCVCFGVS